MAVVRNLAANDGRQPDKPSDASVVISKQFAGTDTGVSDTAVLRSASITIGGTFVGTVVLQRQDRNNNWIDIQSFTAAGQATLDDAASRPTRFNCTAHTSGTIYCEALS